ncbi:hypothetical protein CmeUKMEL1_01735 [Cryptosporidium meleagridis]|uniref:Integral membrane protein n=1 Tax=Cryptosporidium meleagridis TaxID=93969 RepID=A0A2P4YX95_9CRYT|nr:hypothetical protein CmeUKMEL1_01735 [Cryptosporidium meleagridis]
MKLINIFSFIFLLFVIFGDFTEKSVWPKISFVRTKVIHKEGNANDGRIIPGLSDTPKNEDSVYIVEELSDLSEEDDDYEDEIIFIDNMERSNLDEPVSNEDDTLSSGDEQRNINDSQNIGELEIDNKSKIPEFNTNLYFNSHKCFLMLSFEVEFLENPILNNSGVLKYIKEAEINTEGEAIKNHEHSDDEKYKLIELETRNKKRDEIISLMKNIRESCWNITSKDTLEEFKNEILDIIEVVKSKICQINIKLENYIKITDKKNSEFDSENYESNMEKKSKLFGRKSSYELALSSLERIKEYWTHIENLPCNI